MTFIIDFFRNLTSLPSGWLLGVRRGIGTKHMVEGLAVESLLGPWHGWGGSVLEHVSLVVVGAPLQGLHFGLQLGNVFGAGHADGGCGGHGG